MKRVSITYPGKKCACSTHLTFDQLSNILSIAETSNDQTQTITTDIPADSTYSKLNQYERFDQWGLSYDLNGNLTQKSTQHNIYDYRNRIVKATDGSSTVNFKYDPLGRRIQKEVTIGSQNKTTNFYYSGHQVIEERDGSDQITRQLIYGNGIDEVIRVDKYNGTTSTPYYFHINEIGSITAITDANGNIIERVYYDLYGMSTFKDASGNVLSKSSIGNNILFQGREYDPELNLYYFSARYYDPIMGRFLQTDPMGYADSMNLYQAFGMNPVNFVDPFGEGVLTIKINKKPVKDLFEIPGNIERVKKGYKQGEGRVLFDVKFFDYELISEVDDKRDKFLGIRFNIEIEIDAYFGYDAKFTALHEMGHVSDIKSKAKSFIGVLKDIEKLRVSEENIGQVLNLAQEVKISFYQELETITVFSALFRDTFFLPSYVNDILKFIFKKMPKEGSETTRIEF
jgi:RHS repeat-associated protein